MKAALSDLDRAARLLNKFVEGIADHNAVRRAEHLEQTSHARIV